MTEENLDMSGAIVPKSDQLNADDMIAGPRTVTIRKATIGSSGTDQPVSIFYDGDDNKPYKPCKSMCRVMVQLWGNNAAKYIGRRMTLYRDPKVTWGGMEVGGIRISHMSDIEAPVVKLVLTESKSKRGFYTVKRLDPIKEQKKGDINQARVALDGADSATAETLLETLREYSWTREEKLELKKLGDEAKARIVGKQKKEQVND